jgi:beta-lactamase regulating signal transducer with metallopeptidase domain
MALIARHDNGIGLVSALFRALTFFSPAAYVGVRFYMVEREKAADDLAVRMTGDRLALASAIVKVARTGKTTTSYAVAGTASAGAGRVTERVHRLLDGVSESKQVKAPFVVASITGLLLITLFAC